MSGHRRLKLATALHLERVVFAAKARAARAILGLSQTEFGLRIGLTQKSVHRIEQAAVDCKLRTRRAIEQFLRESGLRFDELPDGGFRVVVEAVVLEQHNQPDTVGWLQS